MPDRWICPFCPLHCEDATVERLAGGAAQLRPACPRGQASLDRLDWDRQTPLSAEQGGQPVAYASAVAAAARRLRDAPQIAIRGSFGGFTMARSIIHFGESLGACLEPTTSVGQQALRRAISRDGLISATLGDVRRYADLVLLIGQPEQAYPRLVERFLSEGLVAGRTRQRVAMTRRDDAEALLPPVTEQPADLLAVSPAELSRLIAAWRVDEQGSAAKTSAPDLTARLQRAEYIAVIVGPDVFSPWGLLGGEVEAAGLLDAVAHWNRRRRAVLVAPDASVSFRQVAVWQSGFAGPVRWDEHVPSPLERSAFAQLWEAPETVRVEIAAAADVRQPDEPAGGTGTPAEIVLTSEGGKRTQRQAAEIVLPIAAPGVDTPDTVVRGDGSITLPLRPLRPRWEPTLAETLVALAEAAATPHEGIVQK